MVAVEHLSQNVLRLADRLMFYGITSRGTVQHRELFRFMEGTGPRWWPGVCGMTREEFWTSRRRVLVARSNTIRTFEAGCRPADEVVVEHVIRHGLRDRPPREPENGFVDTITVRRKSDGVVLADLTMDTVWLDFSTGRPTVATTPPDGLNCPLEELPAIAPLPALREPTSTTPFRWTVRETDVTNGHVSALSYFERAENALTDAGVTLMERPAWQAWYRQEFRGDDRTSVLLQSDGDSFVFGFVADGERRPRVYARLSDAGHYAADS